MDSVASELRAASRCSTARSRVLDTLARSGPCTLADLVRETGLAAPDRAPARGRARTARRSWSRDARRPLPARRPARRRGARPPGAALALVEPARAGARPARAPTTGESAQLYVREGDHRVCVAAHERPSGLRDTVPLGAVMPLDQGLGRQGARSRGPPIATGSTSIAAMLADGARRRVGRDRRRARAGRRQRERAGARRRARWSPRSA